MACIKVKFQMQKNGCEIQGAGKLKCQPSRTKNVLKISSFGFSLAAAKKKTTPKEKSLLHPPTECLDAIGLLGLGLFTNWSF